MSKSQRKYQVGKYRQLIDLNGEIVNFELNFDVKSVDKKPFHAVVVDQTTLDSNSDISYKYANSGEISGTIVADKNVYQNYFLLLKADEMCDCIVSISLSEIPVDKNAPPPPPPQQAFQKSQNRPALPPSSHTHLQQQNSKEIPTWAIIMAVFGILLLVSAYYGYKHYSNKKNGINC